jgi:hypothetical protein
MLRRLFSATIALTLCAAAAEGQGTSAIDGPPAPVAPATITRDAANRATVRAIKLSAPLKVDGVLDEDVYKREQPFGGLVQAAPNYGAPSTEKSEIWVMYDDKYMYVTCKCYDAAPPEQWIVNEKRRDTGGLRNNEHIGVLFDTFYDRRSGFAFYTNPLGARADYSVIDEGGSNTDWNPVWTSKTGRFDGGYTVEMAIPFKSLRYRAGPNQVWGIQIRRSIRHKNEWTYLTPVPRILAGPQALNRVSAGGTLVGLDLPASGANIEIKPYGISRVFSDYLRTPKIVDRKRGELGGDVKYAVTPNLTADLTLNTDFAQVEVDEQQVNLTRFNIFYPEKRDFFLEGRGIFDFARGGTGVSNSGSADLPYLFYTRRIGLNGSTVVPINAGGRLTGKLGPWAIGAMNIGTEDDAPSLYKATNFSVFRLKRDVLKRSAVGVMATSRNVATTGVGSNDAFGADGTFQLSQELWMSTYWAATRTRDQVAGDLSGNSYQGLVDWSPDKYGAHVEYLAIDKNFDPQVGFRRRADINRSFASLRYSPRPKHIKSIRKFTWTGSGEYIENSAGDVDGRSVTGSFGTEFENSDVLTFSGTSVYEMLKAPFTPAGSPAAIPAGGYTYPSATVSYQFGAQRKVSGMLAVQAGEFYDGTIKSVTFGASGGNMTPARIALLKSLAVEPTISFTRIERSAGNFTTRLARTRVDYAFSPLMFVSALLQYSSADRAFSTNLRYRWEYAPGSELFLVYTDERDMTPDSFVPQPTVTGTRNRAFVVKVNRLFRY